MKKFLLIISLLILLITIMIVATYTLKNNYINNIKIG